MRQVDWQSCKATRQQPAHLFLDAAREDLRGLNPCMEGNRDGSVPDLQYI